MSEDITNKPYDHKKYEDFMEKWKKESGYEDESNKKYFCYDGPICCDEPINDNKWKESLSRIMFLLKESYNKFHNIRYEPCHGNMPNFSAYTRRFWRNMRMSTYIIDKAITNGGNVPSFADTEEKQNDLNDSIAYVNLKKCVEEGKTKSNPSDIKKYVIRDKDKLLEQIDLIKPRIIVCSGTFKYCQYLYNNNLKKTAHEKLYLYEKENRYFINFWHPSWWIKSPEVRYNKLRDIVKHIK
jgi:hypothetical protein